MFRQKILRWSWLSVVLVLLISVVAYGCGGSAPATPAPAAPTKSQSAPAATAPATKPAAASTQAPAGTKAPGAPVATPAAAAPAKPSGTPIKVAHIAPLSGAFSPYGVGQQIAAKLALEDINGTGGINGRPLELDTFDSPFNPQQAVTGVRKVAEQDKVFAIVGPFSSGEVEAAAPVANQLQIPLIAAAATKPGIIAPNRPWAYRYVELDETAFPVAVDAFKKVYPSVKTFVITGDVKDAVYEYSLSKLWPRVLKEKGYELKETLNFERGMTDFSGLVTKIKGINPDGVGVTGNIGEVALVAKELERQGVKKPVITGFGTEMAPLLATVGTAAEGWVGPRHSSPENPDPAFQKFLARFNQQVKAQNIKIDQLSLEPATYDVLMILADIMRKNNITPETNLQQARTTIRDAFGKVKDWKGVFGTVSVGQDGETHWQAYPHVAKNGKWQLIK